MNLDLFSGVRGWEANTDISALGIENNSDAAETATLNGYRTLTEDIREVPTDLFRNVQGLMGSPPCTKFSPAGNGSGRLELPLVLENLRLMRSTTKYLGPSMSPDAWLLLEPMRFIMGCNPRWIALEQVPAILPVWEAYANILRERGYSVDTGILSSEQFGLGTVRKRAFLVASRTKSVTLPRPTHSAYYRHRPSYTDKGLPRWKSMADVLGWGMTSKPAGTVTAGGTSSGGAEPFGNGQRQSMLVEYQEGRWIGPWNPRPDVLDLATLQTFREDFQFYGKKGSVARQIGNAVPPEWGKIILEKVL
jgi:DNA (cytosine-5)-methyltransferase 1